MPRRDEELDALAAAEQDDEPPLSRARPLVHPPGYALRIPVGDHVVTAPIPKDREGNIKWRRRILERAERSDEDKAAFLALCSSHSVEGFLYWVNAFGYTFRQNTIDTATGKQKSITGGGVDVPFITWPVQDELAGELISCIETGTNAAVDKSRDMGMSWLIATVFLWYWQFREGVNFRVMSRVEELVDNPGDPDSIFWKLDYLIAGQPGWLLPPHRRTYMKLIRTDVPGTTIVGRSTTGKQGRAGRATAVLFDEAAFIDVLKPLWVSMSSTSDCLIANSTAGGPGFFSKLVRSPNVHQLSAPWWDHPEKGRGRTEAVSTGEPGHAPAGQVEIVSPWFNQRCAQAVDPMEIAQELSRDHMGAGFVFFSDVVLNRQAAGCEPPLYIGDLAFNSQMDQELALARRRVDLWGWEDLEGTTPRGCWELWIDGDEDEDGQWRPPQDRTYVMGMDISYGLGKSESTCIVLDLETGEQVGQYASRFDEPTDFARKMCAASWWWGGLRGCAFMCWEANGGQGQSFGRTLRRLRHPWLYFNVDETKRSRPKDDRFGWHSNPHSKKAMLLLLGSGMARADVTLRSKRLVDQCREYIHYDNGGCGPGELQTTEGPELELHGDLVIGGGLARYALNFAHRCRPPDRVALPGSPAWRRERAKERGRRDPELARIRRGG